MRSYLAAPGSPFSDADAAVIGPELERVARERGVSVEEVVAEASDPASPLHDYFEWDDEVAAVQYRKRQAARMAAAIMVKVQDRSGGYRTVRAFYSVQIEERTGERKRDRVYVTVGRVKESPALGEQVIEQALEALLSWRDRYEDYREVFPAFEDRFGPVFEIIGEGR